MSKHFRVVDLAYMAVCAALIAICSWISIPAAVPFTMQTFAVFCVLGFVLVGLIYWAAEKFFGTKLPVRIAAMVLGLAVCYAFGTAWFMLVYARNSGAIALATALGWCVLPFLIPDLVKMGFAVLLSERLRKYLH